MPMPKAAAIPSRPRAALPPAAASAPCANAAGATNIAIASVVRIIDNFFILPPCWLRVENYNPDAVCRQEVVPGHRAAGLTLCSKVVSAARRLVLFAGGHAQINRGQNREDVRLNDCNENVQADEQNRDRCRKNSQQNSRNRR